MEKTGCITFVEPLATATALKHFAKPTAIQNTLMLKLITIQSKLQRKWRVRDITSGEQILKAQNHTHMKTQQNQICLTFINLHRRKQLLELLVQTDIHNQLHAFVKLLSKQQTHHHVYQSIFYIHQTDHPSSSPPPPKKATTTTKKKKSKK